MKNRFIAFVSVGIMAVFVAFVPTTALAVSAKTGSDVSLGKSETHQGTLYASGQSITINGAVNGDFVCAGQTVTINGAVSGDVICASQTLTINGAVAGNVRVMAQTVAINAPIGKNLNVLAQTVNFGSAASVGGEAGIWAETAVVSAPVGSSLYGSMGTLTLESTVGGNVDVFVQDLSLGSEAKITGNLGYASSATFDIDDAQVDGSIRRSDLPQGESGSASNDVSLAGWIAGELYVLGSVLVVALFLAWLAPLPIRRVTDTMLDRPGQSIGWGFVGQIAFLFVGIMLLISVLGVMLAILGFVLWTLILALTTVMTGIAFGRFVLKRLSWNSDSLLWAAFVGVVIVTLVTSLPIVGWLLMIVSLWWLTGGLLQSVKYLR